MHDFLKSYLAFAIKFMCHEFEEAVCKKGNNLVLDKITVAYFYYNTKYYLDSHSSEKRGLRSTFLSGKTLQNLPYL